MPPSPRRYSGPLSAPAVGDHSSSMARTLSVSPCPNRACDSGHSVPGPSIVIHAHLAKPELATVNADSKCNCYLRRKSPRKAFCDHEPAPGHPLPHRLDGTGDQIYSPMPSSA